MGLMILGKVPRYPSSSFVVFFFITFRLPRRRPSEMLTVVSEGWLSASARASMGSELSAESGGSSGKGMGSSGGGLASGLELEDWNRYIPSCSIIFLSCSSRSALDFLLDFAAAAVLSMKSASCSSSEASCIGSAQVSFV